MVNTMRQVMYHKARDMFRKAKLPKKTVHAKRFLSDGTQMQTIKSRSLTKVGQKRKFKSTTQSPLKTIPIRQHLKKGSDGKGIGNFV